MVGVVEKVAGGGGCCSANHLGGSSRCGRSLRPSEAREPPGAACERATLCSSQAGRAPDCELEPAPFSRVPNSDRRDELTSVAPRGEGRGDPDMPLQ
jgi:hypothetical protein